jgi:hypothetical protein
MLIRIEMRDFLPITFSNPLLPSEPGAVHPFTVYFLVVPTLTEPREKVESLGYVSSTESQLLTPQRQKLPLGRGKISYNQQWMSMRTVAHIVRRTQDNRRQDWQVDCERKRVFD